MKKMPHSLGWHTIKKLDKKNKIQKIIIVILSVLLLVAVVFGFIGGK